MKITDLKEFNFYIGNTTSGEDIVATNDGIEGNDLYGEYDTDMEINDVSDFEEIINEAIANSDLDEEDKDELGTYLGACITIKDW